jgi:hypothetical protein
MHCSKNSDRGGASPLIVKNLCAQLAPLDLYGPPDLGAVAVGGLRFLIGASRKAVSAVRTRADASEEIVA